MPERLRWFTNELESRRLKDDGMLALLLLLACIRRSALAAVQLCTKNRRRNSCYRTQTAKAECTSIATFCEESCPAVVTGTRQAGQLYSGCAKHGNVIFQISPITNFKSDGALRGWMRKNADEPARASTAGDARIDTSAAISGCLDP